MAPVELEAAVDSAAPREELVTLIVKHEKVTRRNDGTMDTPLNNGAMDTPLNNGAMDTPLNNGAMDTPLNNGAMDTPLNNGAMDTPLLNSCFGMHMGHAWVRALSRMRR